MESVCHYLAERRSYFCKHFTIYAKKSTDCADFFYRKILMLG